MSVRKSFSGTSRQVAGQIASLSRKFLRPPNAQRRLIRFALGVVIVCLAQVPDTARAQCFQGGNIFFWNCTGDLSNGVIVGETNGNIDVLGLSIEPSSKEFGGFGLVASGNKPIVTSPNSRYVNLDTVVNSGGGDKITGPVRLTYITPGGVQGLLMTMNLKTSGIVQDNRLFQLAATGAPLIKSVPAGQAMGIRLNVLELEDGAVLNSTTGFDLSSTGGVQTLDGNVGGTAGPVGLAINTPVKIDAGSGLVSIRSVGGNYIGSSKDPGSGGIGLAAALATPGAGSLELTKSTGGTALIIGSYGGDGDSTTAAGPAGPVEIADGNVTVTNLTPSGGAGIVLQSQPGLRPQDSRYRGAPSDTVTAKGILKVTTEGITNSPALVATSIGGQGSSTGGTSGGDGAKVTIDAYSGSSFQTEGKLSPGIVAQSVGGRGGNSTSKFGLVTFGANGGNGGSGRDVDLTNAGSITTAGDGGIGILAQSLGAGGGAGGNSFGIWFSKSGTAGVAGNSGLISITNSGDITTGGHVSPGIEAQSVGGVGGSGGIAGGTVSIGGGGGTGGIGGEIYINNTGAIKTGTERENGSNSATNTIDGPQDSYCPTGCSRGILAQSISGGGGNGGGVVGFYDVGGKGGTGGQSAPVTVNLGFSNVDGVVSPTLGSSIETNLSDSDGVTAQSLGGGGGNGGNALAVSAAVSAAIGGGGGTGGSGNNIGIQLKDTTITTKEDRSAGINAQSIGGGGGNGGYATAISGSLEGGVSVAVGGKGNNGGGGATITVTATEGNTISTGGHDSSGISAQSIGGGGGNGGAATAIQASVGVLPGVPTVSISTAVGGGAGAGGWANGTNISSDANISTAGDRSHGIIAQAISGGGGNGGSALSASAAVSLTSDPSVPISVGVGGGGGAGGTVGADFSNVNTVTNSGAITTDGFGSSAILVQGIAGGGGSGGNSISGALAIGSETNVPITTSVGGKGDGGGSVIGKTQVTNSGSLTTRGDNADAIVVQSIGGGGGNGGTSIAGGASIAGKSTSISVGVGGGGGKGGSGGDVTIDRNGGTITTTGDLADAIVAQSLGGGGGNGGMTAAGSFSLSPAENKNSVAIDVGVGGKGKGGGSAGEVKVNSDSGGAIRVEGNGGKGIVAQSIGGGGGNGGMAITGAFSNTDGAKDIGVAVGGKADDEGNAGLKAGFAGKVNVFSRTPVIVGTAGAYETEIVALQQGGSAIVAQSIGGAGGAGGLAASAILDKTKDEKGNQGDRSLFVDVGGGGADSGGSSEVRVVINAQTTTLGHLSDAVIAQSISGSGGAGGGTINFESSNKQSKSLNVGVGGKGGGGSSPGTVAVSLVDGGAVQASGAGSRGIVAQSIGGSGGSGGGNHFSTAKDKGPGTVLTVGVGGNSGKAASGAAVSFNMIDGSVTTGTSMASAPDNGAQMSGHAVWLYSIGGGGGSGGAGIMGDATTAKSDSSLSLDVGVGGKSSGGGSGGNINAFVAGSGGTQSPLTGSITTNNWNSHGLYLQSVGNGGGDGGAGIDGDLSNQASKGLNVGIGVSGGGAGNGGVVTAITDAVIDVRGDNSKGIFAQSVGGGGGNGGLGISGDAKGSSAKGTKQVAFGLGGKGGGGGAGGSVTVTNGGNITTGTAAASETSREMDAIFAQSIGGGGGNGAVGIGGSIEAGDESGGMSLTLGIGLKGGAGDPGGVVDVTNSGDLQFAGDGSRGIFAQSIGGGGGNAGAGVQQDVTSKDDKEGSEEKRTHLDIGIGGKGGGAAGGNKVTVRNTGSIRINAASDAETMNATGILAQSIGGGGGNAGIGIDGDITGTKNTRALTVGIGGKGAGGGNGQTVDVTHSGAISVTGDAGRGIFAQSIGNGGGNGAFGVQGTIATGSSDDKGDNGESNEGQALTFGLGQTGGAGGDGSAVTVLVDTGGSIVTGDTASASNRENSDAFAIHAQSLGGGGGTGILTGGLIWGNANGDDTAKGIDIAVGSSIKGGGNGGAVTVTQRGTLTTYYNASHGLYAQSIGGGGGHAGSLGGIGTDEGNLTWGGTFAVGGSSSSGDGGAVTINMDNAAATVTTHGSGSHGIFAQSIGGGGGDAANAAGQFSTATGENANYTTKNAKIGITVGGKEGAAGKGGKVTVQGAAPNTPALGTIRTAGTYSMGIFAQSVGGGGGTAGTGLSGDQGTFYNLGGDGNAGSALGPADSVQVTFGGTIASMSGSGHAILAQSVGGGGGYGGAFGFDGDNLWGGDLDMVTDGSGNGSGGGVLVDLRGATLSTGSQSTLNRINNAAGVFAQSVGGGGGILGTPDPTESSGGAKIGSAGGAGNAGTVLVQSSGGTTIDTYGQMAHGIFAQSAASQDRSGSVIVTLADTQITTRGRGAAGIVAQTASGSKGVGGVSITIDETSAVTGGTTSSLSGSPDATIWVLDGNDANVINNSGSIISNEGIKGVAVRYTGGAKLTVNNAEPATFTGVTAGNVILPTGGLAAEAPTTGSGITINNAGTMNSAGRLDADQVNNTGTLHVGGESNASQLTVSGNLHNREGGLLALEVNTDNGDTDTLMVEGDAKLDGTMKVSLLGSGEIQSGTTEIISASGDLDLDGLDIQSSPTATNELTRVGENRAHLRYTIDFANEDSLDDLSSNAGSVAEHFDQVYNAGALDDDVTEAFLNVGSTEQYQQTLNTLGLGQDIANQIVALNSVLRFNQNLFSCPDDSNVTSYLDNGQCYYFRVSTRRFDREATSELESFRDVSVQLAAGAQFMSDTGQVYGGSISYETQDTTFDDDPAESDGYQVQAGLSVKHYSGPWELGAGVSFGFGSVDFDRTVVTDQSVKGDRDYLTYGAELRAAYLVDKENWYLKPMVSLGMAGISTDGYTESGSTGTELRVEGQNDHFFYLRPAIEFGGTFDAGGGTIVRPKLTLAINQLLGDTTAVTTARLASAPSSVGSFDWSASLDETRFDITAGVDIFTGQNAIVSLDAIGAFSENSSELGAGLRVSIPF